MDNGGKATLSFSAMTTLLPRIELESAPNPSATVIWLHGLGADGNDFAGHGARAGPGLAARRSALCFHTRPSIPVTINGGYVMPAWYDILGVNLVRPAGRPRASRSPSWAIHRTDRERSGARYCVRAHRVGRFQPGLRDGPAHRPAPAAPACRHHGPVGLPAAGRPLHRPNAMPRMRTRPSSWPMARWTRWSS